MCVYLFISSLPPKECQHGYFLGFLLIHPRRAADAHRVLNKSLFEWIKESMKTGIKVWKPQNWPAILPCSQTPLWGGMGEGQGAVSKLLDVDLMVTCRNIREGMDSRSELIEEKSATFKIGQWRVSTWKNRKKH